MKEGMNKSKSEKVNKKTQIQSKKERVEGEQFNFGCTIRRLIAVV